jgi:uncharacterized protein YcbK (DUF882 family)
MSSPHSNVENIIIMNRRKFITFGLKAAAGFTLLQAVPAWAGTGKRSLSFYHTHTNECLDITYARAGIYDPLALSRVNEYLRDFRTGEKHRIDPGVLDILWRVQQEMGCSGTFEVISGYRSPKTNQALRGKSKAVARHSLHMKGRAIDIRLTGQNTRHIRDCAIGLKSGGVGYYAKSNFVHLDTGRVRTW